MNLYISVLRYNFRRAQKGGNSKPHSTDKTGYWHKKEAFHLHQCGTTNGATLREWDMDTEGDREDQKHLNSGATGKYQDTVGGPRYERKSVLEEWRKIKSPGHDNEEEIHLDMPTLLASEGLVEVKNCRSRPRLDYTEQLMKELDRRTTKNWSDKPRTATHEGFLQISPISPRRRRNNTVKPLFNKSQVCY